MAGRWPAGWQLGVAGSVVYVQNWLYAAGVHLGPMGHAWTLSIEEQFYALWPLALVLLPIRRLAAAIAVLIVAAIVWRAAFSLSDGLRPDLRPRRRAARGCRGCDLGPSAALLDRASWRCPLMLGLAFTPFAGTLEITVAATAIVIMAAPRALEPLAAAGRRS